MRKFLQRIRLKIGQIKEQCQKNNLNQALQMRKELAQLQRQLLELHERSRSTSLLSCYFKPSNLGSYLNDPVADNCKLIKMMDVEVPRKPGANKDRYSTLQSSSTSLKPSSASLGSTPTSLNYQTSRSNIQRAQKISEADKSKTVTDLKSKGAFAFNQVAFLIRKQYDARMQ